MFVDVARVTGCQQDAVQDRFRIHGTLVPADDLRWAVASILALFMCPVPLVVVILHPFAMNREGLFPTGDESEFGISHSTKDIEMGFYVVLPRLSLINAFFVDTKRLVDFPSMIAVKDSCAITDNRFGNASGREGREEDFDVIPLA